MFRMRPWMRSEHLQEWTQTLVLLIGAAWGIYTFWYKDIWLPSWQPANLTLEATITPVEGRRPSPDGLEAILEAKATNSSTRQVFLLPNYWLISGIKRTAVGPQESGNEGRLQSQANLVLAQKELTHFEPHVSSELSPSLLAVGRLFDDNIVQPGETIRRRILFRIPKGMDGVELRALLPLLTKKPDATLFNGRRLRWELSDPINISPLLCLPSIRAAANPNCKPVDIRTLGRELKRFDSHQYLVNFSSQFGLPDGLGHRP